jgi:hypothetical protein
MNSHAEDILEKLKMLFQAGSAARIERNTVVPERIPNNGLVIIRDGNPGEPDRVIGGFASVYYSHAIEVEIYIQEGSPAQRDIKFDALAQEIGAVLEANPDLQGLVAGLTYGRPETHTQAIDGGAAIKTGTIIIVADYQAETPLT